MRRDARVEFVVHHKDLAPGVVYDRCRSDTNRGGDVPARKVPTRDRGAHRGLPEHGAAAGSEGVYRVSFSGYVHPARGFERLPVELTVQGS